MAIPFSDTFAAPAARILFSGPINRRSLFRGAGLSAVWPQMLAMIVIGAAYFGISLYNFRRVVFSS